MIFFRKEITNTRVNKFVVIVTTKILFEDCKKYILSTKKNNVVLNDEASTGRASN